MKCYWCGKENKNLQIDPNGKIEKHFPCNDCNQPERSKREDSSIEEMRCSELYGNIERDK